VTHLDYLDTLGIWEATVELPEQVEQAWAEANRVLDEVPLPPLDDIHSIAIVGMGSSGLAGSAAAAYAAPMTDRPMWVGHQADLSGFVGPHTLFFAVSHSGTTEEIRSATHIAFERGASVVLVGGNGRPAAGSLARLGSLPELPVSRAALGAFTVSVLATLARIGLIPAIDASIEAAALALRRRRDAQLKPDSEAERVARLIGRTIPLVYGSSGVIGVAAQRWKTQINENAKTAAFTSVLPDLAHNEVAGWGQHGDITRQVLTLVTLRSAGEHPALSRQFDSVIAATDEVMSQVIPVWAEGDDDLSRFFDLALLGDFVSLHLAGRENTDPGPVPTVQLVEGITR
jgi:glucose/mannose-6-phosphate isomerase